MIFPSGISSYDYSQTLAERGWSAGWPACLVPLPLGLGIHTRDIVLTRSGTVIKDLDVRIADLKEILFNEIERRGYLFHPGWCWGGQCRCIAGTLISSNHAFFCATDINAPNNSYNSNGQHDIPDWAYALLRAYGFSLGADYTGSKRDWMHVEFLGTPSDAAAMTAIARRAFSNLPELQVPTNPVTPTPTPTPTSTSTSTQAVEEDDMFTDEDRNYAKDNNDKLAWLTSQLTAGVAANQGSVGSTISHTHDLVAKIVSQFISTGTGAGQLNPGATLARVLLLVEAASNANSTLYKAVVDAAKAGGTPEEIADKVVSTLGQKLK